YYQIVSDKNAIKSSLYCNHCLLTEENFDDCIFIDECMIELDMHTLKNWVHKESRYYKAPIVKHPLKLLLSVVTKIFIDFSNLELIFLIDIIKKKDK
ncbi:hypothetical protein BpHYR1_031878, partial [Brachionus plicatilis]